MGLLGKNLGGKLKNWELELFGPAWEEFGSWSRNGGSSLKRLERRLIVEKGWNEGSSLKKKWNEEFGLELEKSGSFAVGYSKSGVGVYFDFLPVVTARYSAIVQKWNG